MTDEIINNLDGVLPDPRSPLDIAKDYNQEEIIPTAVVLNWDRDMSGAPKYSVRDQDGSYSCVGQGAAKALEILTGTVASAHPTYRRRGNFPGRGMWLQDAFDIIKRLGTTTEANDISQSIDETQMNRDLVVNTPLKDFLYIRIDPIDIDQIATAIETQKQCVITVVSSYAEWDVVKPVLNINAQTTFGHCITATYYFKDEQGKKCLLVDESWGLKQITQRILTEDFIKARCFGAMYFLKPEPAPIPVKPQFRFQSILLYGQSNYSVHMLQECLKYEGFFPNMKTTQYYGLITAKALLKWQFAHNVAGSDELNYLQGKRAGEKTIKMLNSIYAV